MKKILVTGGLGFIGSNFIRMLLQENSDLAIINLDKQTYAGNPANLADLSTDSRYQVVIGDIGDAPLVSKILAEYEPDAVVNFAAESHVDRSIDSPELFVETNVLGTLHLLDASRKFFSNLDSGKKDVFRFLHVSTDEVYGTLSTTDPAFCEKTPYAPNSPYSASKAGADHLVRSYFHTYDFPVLTTNCSNNYGPYQFPEKLIPLMILNACAGKDLPIYGDGRNIRDWLHVEDHCRGILAVLNKGRVGDTYCIGGNSEKTNLQIIDTICSLLDSSYPANAPHTQFKTFVEDRPGHDRRYAIDSSKIEDELGWRPQYSFDSGIAQTVEWYLKNPAWCASI
jgi:dTDP-glucose 4,6-dehydratase